MITLLILWFIAELHLAAHDTTTLTTYELLYEQDMERIATEEAEFAFNQENYTAYSSTRKGDRNQFPKHVNAVTYYNIKQTGFDIAWDDERGSYRHGHRRRDYKKHGTHGSKGQANARWNTRAYAYAREMKYSHLAEYLN